VVHKAKRDGSGEHLIDQPATATTARARVIGVFMTAAGLRGTRRPEQGFIHRRFSKIRFSRDPYAKKIRGKILAFPIILNRAAGNECRGEVDIGPIAGRIAGVATFAKNRNMITGMSSSSS